MSRSPAVLHRPLRVLGGAALGSLAWPLDLVLGCVAVLTPRGARPVRPVAALVAWHRRRTSRLLAWADDDAPLTSPRAAAYLATRVAVGLLGLVVLALLAYGLFAVVVGLASWLFDVRFTVEMPVRGEEPGVTTASMLILVPLGAVLLYLDLMGLYGVGVLDRAAAARWLAPSRSERLAAQVESLTVSRAELLAALDAERGRIERDLHDGVQQRAVAVGLLVDRARRAGVAAGGPGVGLLEQASREVGLLVTDLREVAWRVRPTTLDTHGLEPVLRQLVDRAAVPTTLEWRCAVRLPGPVETTVYYVVAEALTNVAKHSGARTAQVELTSDAHDGGAVVRVTVGDDGVGGAQALPGHGLAGLAGRVAAAGGAITVDSPAGGPTRIGVTLPCA
ncbi:sensor histidine kinase [Promicromonospora thailandica]|uniref:histidine kinase n=1 Tax=Promicromonospora thailandica TaxID=765201 RepID=A0A9X2JXW5_9MICO|nr:histidine kinase [Promicromonospora thailandica]MCP2266613.1 Signal transduction histidine kinase [Promicromonospora thailandica]